METKLEQIAAKARCEPKLRFTSLAHHITRDRVRKSLSQIPNRSAAGVDGQTVEEAKKSFGRWIEPMLQSVNRRGYRAPNIRRVYIPKPGKQEKRPLGVPTVSDRALQRSTAQVLSAIYEQDFLPCSWFACKKSPICRSSSRKFARPRDRPPVESVGFSGMHARWPKNRRRSISSAGCRIRFYMTTPNWRSPRS